MEVPGELGVSGRRRSDVRTPKRTGSVNAHLTHIKRGHCDRSNPKKETGICRHKKVREEGHREYSFPKKANEARRRFGRSQKGSESTQHCSYKKATKQVTSPPQKRRSKSRAGTGSASLLPCRCGQRLLFRYRGRQDLQAHTRAREPLCPGGAPRNP